MMSQFSSLRSVASLLMVDGIGMYVPFATLCAVSLFYGTDGKQRGAV